MSKTGSRLQSPDRDLLLHGLDVYTYLVDVLQCIGQNSAFRRAELTLCQRKMYRRASPDNRGLN